MSKSKHPKKVSEAGKKLASSKSSKKERSEAAEILREHQEKRH